MNFSYGIIAAVGVLVAAILGLVAADPGYVPEEHMPEPIVLAPMAATVSLPEGSALPGCDVDNECFIPYVAEISAGGAITWNNDDTAAHTVTSGTAEGGPDGMFDSGLFMPGATFDFTFDDVGKYDYYCIVHPWMVGKIITT